jgi:hypothetical protein
VRPKHGCYSREWVAEDLDITDEDIEQAQGSAKSDAKN